jgi:hypothetical protein
VRFTGHGSARGLKRAEEIGREVAAAERETATV